MWVFFVLTKLTEYWIKNSEWKISLLALNKEKSFIKQQKNNYKIWKKLETTIDKSVVYIGSKHYKCFSSY